MVVPANERDPVDRKIINVSRKRQITIPLKFYRKIGLGSEVECFLKDDAIVIRPVYRDSGEFSVEILKDLIARGYAGDELVKEFEEQNKNIKHAVGNLLEEADAIASGSKKAAKFDDLFSEEI
jgi:bifunctional DNA-binding transcriptional regulator/antitoxin component of YhaV-PrlF toxin-antitoxin module